MDQIVAVDPGHPGEGLVVKKRRHAINEAFRVRFKAHQAAAPNDEFSKYFMMQTTRAQKNKLIDLWDQLGRGGFDRVMERVRLSDERIQEETTGSRGRYVQEEQLVSIYGKNKANVYMNNCRKLQAKFPELVEWDSLFEAETFLLCDRVMETMSKERLTVNFITEPSNDKLSALRVGQPPGVGPQPLQDHAPQEDRASASRASSGEARQETPGSETPSPADNEWVTQDEGINKNDALDATCDECAAEADRGTELPNPLVNDEGPVKACALAKRDFQLRLRRVFCLRRAA
jgi:hypothetical protein